MTIHKDTLGLISWVPKNISLKKTRAPESSGNRFACISPYLSALIYWHSGIRVPVVRWLRQFFTPIWPKIPKPKVKIAAYSQCFGSSSGDKYIWYRLGVLFGCGRTSRLGRTCLVSPWRNQGFIDPESPCWAHLSTLFWDPKASHALAPKRPDSPTAKGSTARAVYWSQLPAESAWATQSPIAGCGTWKCTGNQVVKEYWRSLYWLGVFLSINHGFGLGDKDPNPTQTLPGLVETYAFCQGGFGKTRRDHKPLLRFLRFSEIQWVQEWTFVTTEVCANPGHQVDVCANWFGRAG